MSKRKKVPPRSADAHATLADWLAANGWQAFDYQRQAWQAYRDGHSGLVNAPTGTGKTYSVWLGVVQSWLDAHPDPAEWPRDEYEPLRAIWVTPLRALATDLVHSLRAPIEALGMPWQIELRTGDTTSSVRQRHRKRLPTALVTTPESLSLMLSYPDAHERLAQLECVVVDEWHEQMGSKRGVQTELALARLRRWNPRLRTWGLSATLGNLEEALDVLMGAHRPAVAPVLVRGREPKQIVIETILPEDIQRFPWGGHLGLRLLEPVVNAIENAKSTLVFTNTRSQAEIWFREILKARPAWAAEIAVHHGSIDRDLRRYVECRLRAGDMRAVVCTSSLDLGVDFTPVDQIIQIGSPKGIARLLQRAGRSGHRPGATSRVLCVPTHALELVEYAAARTAAEQRMLEGRRPPDSPLDVLVQHLVTVAIGTGFDSDDLYDEVRTAYSFRNLSRAEWQWCLDFVAFGGPSLRAYPQFARVVHDGERYGSASPLVARMHRLAIGTITSDTTMLVRMMRGRSLGTIEESFIARLRPGDRFFFAGQTLELVRTRDMTAYVRKSRKTSGLLPRWDGGRFPLSSELAAAVRDKLAEAARGDYRDEEMLRVRPLLELQRQWSHLPTPDSLVVEHCKLREGYAAWIFPFEGRNVNEGLASLLAFRISRRTPASLTTTTSDYGFELLSSAPLDFDEAGWRRLLSTDDLLDDMIACLNASELARRQFRDIARVAGLVFPGYPGAPKSIRQLQVSSGLLYDVFREYDPANLLLDQARREVLERQLEVSRLRLALNRVGRLALAVTPIKRLTPLSFPLWAARIQTTHLSTERWTTRVERMAAQLERAAAKERY